MSPAYQTGTRMAMRPGPAMARRFYLRALREADTLFHPVDPMTAQIFANAEAVLSRFEQLAEPSD